MSWSTALLAATIAFVAGLVLQPLSIRWLRRRGILDIPNHRSSHAATTPRGGGLAVIAALLVGTLAVSTTTGPTTAVLLGGCIVLGGVGLVDDLRGLPPQIRLLAQLGVGALAGLLLPEPIIALAAILVCSVWVASFVNAFNFMDGINGISALTGLVAGIAYSAMGYHYGDPEAAAFSAALAGACLAFLPFNTPKARVFLGDVGSYALGFAIAALGWAVWAAGAPLLLALAPTSVYLVDTGSTLVRRWRRGEALTQAHREHVYQRLTQAGWSHIRTSTFVALVQVSVIVVTSLGALITPWFTILAVPVLGLYLLSPRVLQRSPAHQ